LNKEEVKQYLDFHSNSEEIEKYLRGESFAMDVKDGWTLVTVEGYSLGWAKITDGILKNHYPKGLRKQ